MKPGLVVLTHTPPSSEDDLELDRFDTSGRDISADRSVERLSQAAEEPIQPSPDNIAQQRPKPRKKQKKRQGRWQPDPNANANTQRNETTYRDMRRGGRERNNRNRNPARSRQGHTFRRYPPPNIEDMTIKQISELFHRLTWENDELNEQVLSLTEKNRELQQRILNLEERSLLSNDRRANVNLPNTGGGRDHRRSVRDQPRPYGTGDERKSESLPSTYHPSKAMPNAMTSQGYHWSKERRRYKFHCMPDMSTRDGKCAWCYDATDYLCEFNDTWYCHWRVLHLEGRERLEIKREWIKHISDRQYLLHPNWKHMDHPFRNRKKYIVREDTLEEGYLLKNRRFLTRAEYNDTNPVECECVRVSVDSAWDKRSPNKRGPPNAIRV